MFRDKLKVSGITQEKNNIIIRIEQMGVDKKNIMVVDNGIQVEVTPGGIKKVGTVPAEGVSEKASEIFLGTFKAGQGNNDFSVGAALSRPGLRGTEYVFEFDAGTSPETAADLDCELINADGRVLKCSGLVFSRGVLKCVFVFPEDFDPRKATTLRLICGNGSAPTLRRITEREI